MHFFLFSFNKTLIFVFFFSINYQTTKVIKELKRKKKKKKNKLRTYTMRSFKYIATVIIILLVFLPIVMNARHIPKINSYERHMVMSPTKKTTLARGIMAKRADTLQVAGSRLPDCSHACGSCKPCRLVMVSFVCSSLEEAETCPVAYKCMCHNKSYPVP